MSDIWQPRMSLHILVPLLESKSLGLLWNLNPLLVFPSGKQNCKYSNTILVKQGEWSCLHVPHCVELC